MFSHNKVYSDHDRCNKLQHISGATSVSVLAALRLRATLCSSENISFSSGSVQPQTFCAAETERTRDSLLKSTDGSLLIYEGNRSFVIALLTGNNEKLTEATETACTSIAINSAAFGSRCKLPVNAINPLVLISHFCIFY